MFCLVLFRDSALTADRLAIQSQSIVGDQSVLFDIFHFRYDAGRYSQFGIIQVFRYLCHLCQDLRQVVHLRGPPCNTRQLRRWTG